MSDRIAEYLASLAQQLPADLDPAHRQRILDEVADHLRQRASDLRSSAADPQDAEDQAIRRFGAAEEVGPLFTRFVLRPAPSVGLDILATLAIAAGLLAAGPSMLLAAWFVVDTDAVAMRELRFIAVLVPALMAIMVAIATIFARWGTGLARPARWCAFALIPVGVAVVVATIWLGAITGDYEWYGAGIGAAMVAEGLLGVIVLHTASGGRRTAA
jgi:hypothetical protein